jgi:hypothetical protein
VCSSDLVRLEEGKNLENWLNDHDDASFPSYSSDSGEKSYPGRYEVFKDALLPIHNTVEKGAMAAGAIEWMEKTKKIIKKSNVSERQRLLRELIDSDPIAHLNNHGQGHVNKVIEKVSEMLHFFDNGHLRAYEGFFLLCAIQLHDVGNAFGRDEHEKNCRIILDDKCKPYIRDSVEKKVIEKLALVHGGVYNGERDTIGYLSESKTLHDRKVRKKLLAALLRFGDELADDSSRADREGLEQGTILEGSRIYHRYSEALHTVKIEKNEMGKLQVYLSYDFDSDVANQKFIKNGKDKFLLDEIYDRTLKMERERRYCMRYIRPCFSLDSIRVEIIIQNARDTYLTDKIQYTLEEKGYPYYPATGAIKEVEKEIRTGKEEMQHLRKSWGLR